MTDSTTGTDRWQEVYSRRRPYRMGDPLRGRRVRLQDGREGTILGAHGSRKDASVSITVTLDEKKFHEFRSLPGKGYWVNGQFRGKLAEVELLDPPPITAPVRVRRVVFRGTKEQAAQRWATLSPLTDEQRAAGYDRYIEFQPDVAAYRRWRIVSVSPPKAQAEVDALPSEHPRAAAERSARADSVEAPDQDYGY